jgi:hypothetical protein
LVSSVQGSSEEVRFTVGVARRPKELHGLAQRRGLRIISDYTEALSAPNIDGIVLTNHGSRFKSGMWRADRSKRLRAA